MIVPSQRMLLLLSAVVVLPLASAAGFVPGLPAPCIATLALWAIVVAIDAVRGQQRLRGLEARRAAGPAPHQGRADPSACHHLQSTPRAARHPPERHHACRRALGFLRGRDRVAPTGASRFDWACTGVARGDHPLRELHLEAPSPFGLWLARSERELHSSLRVYPNLRDRASAALFQRNSALGLRLRRQIGKGREFDNLRQYIPGDGFEDIDWKATARRQYPVVKLFRVEHSQEVYAVVDSSRLSARPEILESASSTRRSI